MTYQPRSKRTAQALINARLAGLESVLKGNSATRSVKTPFGRSLHHVSTPASHARAEILDDVHFHQAVQLSTSLNESTRENPVLGYSDLGRVVTG